LAKFTNSFDGTILCVEIPNLGFSLTGLSLESGVGPRFRLQFPTKTSLKYEVRFRSSPADAGTVVPFSTTETGAATTNLLTGNNSTVTVFVDRTTGSGFYSVAVQANTG